MEDLLKRAASFGFFAVFWRSKKMVPRARIELATPAFSGQRSTTELPRRWSFRFRCGQYSIDNCMPCETFIP